MLQARAQELVVYPRGKSAMVLYACCRSDDTLQTYLASDRGAAALGRAVAVGARWIRFGVSPHPEVELGRLLERFVTRFGAPPSANITDTDTDTDTDN